MARRALTYGNRFTHRLGVRHPIVLAPMLGVSTPELVASVANSGALAFIGAGSNSQAELRRAVRATRDLLKDRTTVLGVNMFVPAGVQLSPAMWSSPQAAAVVEAQSRKATLMPNMASDSRPFTMQHHVNNFSEQVDAVLEEGIQVTSFHFGWPLRGEVARLKKAGVFLIGNATSVEEAKELQRLGADGIIAQGSEAGGHRGTFLQPQRYEKHTMTRTVPLVRAISAAVDLPIVAAGGLMDGADIAAALTVGASAAQLGTAFLTTTESGVHPLHKRALLDSNDVTTVETQAFTGKPARALVHKWVRNMSDLESRLPNCFNCLPEGHTLASAEVQASNSDMMMMWAGQGYSRCRAHISASDLVSDLVAEARASVCPRDVPEYWTEPYVQTSDMRYKLMTV